MFKQFFLLSLFFLIKNSIFSQNELPVGAKAPDIQFQKSFPKNYSIPKDKPIVLDFWATWCGPCVAGLIEDNELVNKYWNKIEFIAITDTTSKKVEEFIKSRDFKYNFIIDKDTQTFSSFGVSGIPYAFLINKDGIIKWSGYGRDINEQLLREFLVTGEVKEKKEPIKRYAFDDTGLVSEVLTLVIENRKLLDKHRTILKAKVENRLGQFSNSPRAEGKLTVINYSLRELTERINPFFSDKKLQSGETADIGYDFISLPFDSFQTLNAYLKRHYGIYFR